MVIHRDSIPELSMGITIGKRCTLSIGDTGGEPGSLECHRPTCHHEGKACLRWAKMEESRAEREKGLG